MEATKQRTPKDKKVTVSHVTSLYWKEVDVTIQTINAWTNKTETEMIQTTFVKIGLFADNAESNKTNKTSSTIASGEAPVVVPLTFPAT